MSDAAGKARVWFVDDDDDLRPAVVQSLDLEGYRVRAFADPAAMVAALEPPAMDVVVSDIRMAGMDGLNVLRTVHARDPHLPVILVTGHGDVALAVEAMGQGAFDFVEKPFATERLVSAIERAAALRSARAPDPERIAPLPLLGTSPAATELRRDFAAMLAAGQGGLIVGPSGSGHNRLLVHLLEPFEEIGAPVRRINCGNLSPDLAPIEVMSAFDALADGALVLETASLLPDALRHTIASRVADPKPHDPRVFVTLTAASRVDPDLDEAFSGRRIDLPPLAQRREDVLAIFLAFAYQSAARFRRALPLVPPGLASWLANHPLEGNVSEVQATAERFVLGTWSPEGGPNQRLAERVAEHEKLIIETELARHAGRIRATYEALGLSRKGLYDKMKRYGIESKGDG